MMHTYACISRLCVQITGLSVGILSAIRCVPSMKKSSMGPRRCPETSVKDYRSTLRNIPEERRSQ
jgi:hypothetical protein